MYAAAGGASLASRQARQRQRQNKKIQKSTQKAADVLPKPPQASQFHNYTDDVAVGLPPPAASAKPHQPGPRGSLKPPSGHQGAHERRHSASHYHLKEGAAPRARIRESPSICIPVHHHKQPLTPTTLVQQPPSLHSSQLLPQIFIPEGEEGKLERRCSFVRQVEEMEKCQEGDLLDRCNHLCNFEIKDNHWEANTYYADYEHDVFGSLDYPFSECSQGRAAWQERERGRRCSLTDEARQHRIKQTEAHHRWMKKNRIHDSTYGGGSDEDDFFSVYHQSAAANALLYVGLGTTAIGSVIFFVGTGEKGFKTLELRMIGPTLIACGLLCCLIRVLLCACPSTCFRRGKKTRLKSNACPHSSSRYPLAAAAAAVPRYQHHHPHHHHHHQKGGSEDDDNPLLTRQTKKKVSIVPPHHSQPSTSTTEQDLHTSDLVRKMSVPQIHLPDLSDGSEGLQMREDSIIELQHLDLEPYDDVQSVSSNDSESCGGVPNVNLSSKLSRQRQPANQSTSGGALLMPEPSATTPPPYPTTATLTDIETCLSVVIERNDNSDGSASSNLNDTTGGGRGAAGPAPPHSGIVLSPLQLGQQ